MNSFLNVEEKLLLKWRTGPYHAVPCKRSASAADPAKADFSMKMAGKQQRKNNSSNSYERVNSLQ